MSNQGKKWTLGSLIEAGIQRVMGAKDGDDAAARLKALGDDVLGDVKGEYQDREKKSGAIDVEASVVGDEPSSKESAPSAAG